jgi:hypothetical protein
MLVAHCKALEARGPIASHSAGPPGHAALLSALEGQASSAVTRRLPALHQHPGPAVDHPDPSREGSRRGRPTTDHRSPHHDRRRDQHSGRSNGRHCDDPAASRPYGQSRGFTGNSESSSRTNQASSRAGWRFCSRSGTASRCSPRLWPAGRSIFEPTEQPPADSFGHVIGDGFVIVQYNPGLPVDQLGQLRTFVSDPGSGRVVSGPDPAQAEPIKAVHAYQTELICSSY